MLFRSLSHHGKVQAKRDAIAKIDRFHLEQFAAFVQRISERQDGEGNLLGNSMVVLGSGISDGNRHNHHDLPMLLCGEGAGSHQPKGHVALPKRTPAANLYLSMMHAMGCRDASFADSTEALSLR